MSPAKARELDALTGQMLFELGFMQIYQKEGNIVAAERAARNAYEYAIKAAHLARSF